MTTSHDRRLRMVKQQIQARGVCDPRTLDAMRTVPRERFVDENFIALAYEDMPLPIQDGQTISQPFIVAFMIEALDLGLDDRVLEIGAGSGYAAAVLSRIAREVYAVERHDALVTLARERLTRLGYDNVRIHCHDGTLGWADHAPYDAIMVSAGGPDVPESLLRELAVGGRLVMPVGTGPTTQQLIRIRRTDEDEFIEESLGPVQFIPLVGQEGWRSESECRPGR